MFRPLSGKSSRRKWSWGALLFCKYIYQVPSFFKPCTRYQSYLNGKPFRAEPCGGIKLSITLHFERLLYRFALSVDVKLVHFSWIVSTSTGKSYWWFAITMKLPFKFLVIHQVRYLNLPWLQTNMVTLCMPNHGLRAALLMHPYRIIMAKKLGLKKQ